MSRFSILILFICAACLLPLVGCDDDEGGETITCEWLDSEDNCWKQSVTAMQPCFHDSSTEGTFNAELTECSFDDGTVVVFAAPVQLGMDAENALDFEVHKDGAVCMGFQERENGMTATLPSGETFSTVESGMSVAINCPDGGKASASGMGLLECENFFNSFPGFQWSNSDYSFGFSLMGGPDEIDGQEVDGHVFHCVRPTE